MVDNKSSKKQEKELISEVLNKEGLNGEKWAPILMDKIPISNSAALKFLNPNHLKSISTDFENATNFEKERLNSIFGVINKEKKEDDDEKNSPLKTKLAKALMEKGLSGVKWGEIMIQKIPIEDMIGLKYLRPNDIQKIQKEYDEANSIERQILDELFKNTKEEKKKQEEESDTNENKKFETHQKRLTEAKKLIGELKDMKTNNKLNQAEVNEKTSEIIGQFGFDRNNFRQKDKLDDNIKNLDAAISDIQKADKMITRTELSTSELISSIDGGGLLKGFYLVQNDIKETLMKRDQLIEVPSPITMMGTPNDDIIREITTKTQSENASMLEIIKKSGNSVGGEVSVGYMGVSVSASLTKSDAEININQDKTTTQKNFYSKYKFNCSPIRSTEFSPENLKLSGGALKSLFEIEGIYENEKWENIAHSLSNEFFRRFGSHAFLGPFDFGGTYILNCTITCESTEKETQVTYAVSNKLEGSFGVSGYGCEVKATASTESEDAKKNVNFNKELQENATLNLTKHGGPPECNALDTWKYVLSQSNRTWSVISYGEKKESVWKILLRNHQSDFKDVKRLAGILQSSYYKLTRNNYSITEINMSNSAIISNIKEINKNSYVEFLPILKDVISELINVRKELLKQTLKLDSWEEFISNSEIKSFLVRLCKEVNKEELDDQTKINLKFLFRVLPQNYTSSDIELISPFINSLRVKDPGSGNQEGGDKDKFVESEKMVISGIEDFNLIGIQLKNELIKAQGSNDHSKENEIMNKFFCLVFQYMEIIDNEVIDNYGNINQSTNTSSNTNSNISFLNGELSYDGIDNTKLIILKILCVAYLSFIPLKKRFKYTISPLIIQKFCQSFLESIYRYTIKLSPLKFESRLKDKDSTYNKKVIEEYYIRIYCFLLNLICKNVDNITFNQEEAKLAFNLIIQEWSLLNQKENTSTSITENVLIEKLTSFSKTVKFECLLDINSPDILNNISFEFSEIEEFKSLQQQNQNQPNFEVKDLNSLKELLNNKITKNVISENSHNLNTNTNTETNEKSLNFLGVEETSFKNALKFINRSEIITRKEAMMYKNIDILTSIEDNQNLGINIFYQLILKNPKVLRMKINQKENIIQKNDNEGFDDGFDEEVENESKKNNEKNENSSKPPNILDILINLYLISDHSVREILAKNLDMCKQAIPLVFPMSSQTLAILWPLYNIDKCFTSDSGEIRREMVISYKSPIISFVKLGSHAYSKSYLINSMFYSDSTVFIGKKVTYEQSKPNHTEGLVEINWACPETNDVGERYNNLITVLNIRGNSNDLKAKQSFNLIRAISDILVIIPGSKEDMDSVDFNENDPYSLILFNKKSVGADKLNKNIIGINRSGLPQFIKEIIYSYLKDPKYKSKEFGLADRITNFYKQSKQNFEIDLNTEFLSNSKISAQNFIDLIGKSNKNQVLPLQSRDVWGRLVSNDKELNRLNKETNILELTKKRKKLETQTKHLRIQQQKMCNDIHPAMNFFLISILKMNSQEIILFIEWSRIKMNEKNDSELKTPRNEYSKALEMHNKLKSTDQSSAQQMVKENIKELGERIYALSFGLEHVIREIGQIYECIMSSSSTSSDEIVELVNKLPLKVAELMLDGLPVELMDGDNTYVQMTWIAAIFENLNKLTNTKIGVCSILGTQSTGKSTLLNSMFNLKFAVAASRCTKGIFMQLIQLENNTKSDLKSEVGYLILLDTEGLRAPELLESNTDNLKHDNEMATTVMSISDLTLINMMGLTNPSIIEILEIVVHSVLRINSLVNIKPKCMFSHQNINMLSDPKKSNYEAKKMLLSHLDKMTKSIAELTGSKITSFNEVIPIEGDDKYISPLFEGSSSNSSICYNYVVGIHDLKKDIIEIVKKQPVTFKTLSIKLGDLWKAIIQENFSFAFRNTLQLNANSKSEKKYNEYTINYCFILKQFFNESSGLIQENKIKESDFKSESEKKYYQVVEDFKDDFKKYIDAESKDNEYFLEYESTTREQVIKRIKEMCDEYKGPLFNQFQEQRLRNEMNSKLSECYEELFSKAKVFLDQKTEEKKQSEDKNPGVKIQPFTRKEIETAFDKEVWNKIIDKFRSCLNKNEVNENPRQDALNTIKNFFRVDTTLFNDLLKKDWPQKKVIGYDFLNLDNCKGFFQTAWYDYRFESTCKIVLQDHQARKEQFKCIQMEFLTTTKYDSSVFIKAVNKIQTICQMPEDVKFNYLPNYKLYLSVIFCNEIFDKLEALVFEESQKRDPLVILEREYKKKLIDKLEMMYQGMSQIEQCSKQISDILEDKIENKLSGTSKNNNVFKAISERVKFTNTKRSLLRELQSEIIEKRDWNLAKKYITDFKEGVEFYIKNKVDIEVTNDYITELLKKLTNSSYASISDFVAKLDKYSDLKSWLSDFREVIGKNDLIFPLIISEKEFVHIDNFVFNDDTMKIELKKSLDQKVNLNKAQKENLTAEKYFKPSDRLEIRDELVKSVVGCTELCPFCKAPCELTIPEHSGCHTTNYHRFPALFGDTLNLSGKLLVHLNCNGLILSEYLVDDPEILKGNPKFYYKSYKSKFPKWDIAPDNTLSQPAFWKLFIFIFGEQLKKCFNQKDVRKGSTGISGYSLDISQWGNSDIVEATRKHLESYGI